MNQYEIPKRVSGWIHQDKLKPVQSKMGKVGYMIHPPFSGPKLNGMENTSLQIATRLQDYPFLLAVPMDACLKIVQADISTLEPSKSPQKNNKTVSKWAPTSYEWSCSFKLIFITPTNGLVNGNPVKTPTSEVKTMLIPVRGPLCFCVSAQNTSSWGLPQKMVPRGAIRVTVSHLWQTKTTTPSKINMEYIQITNFRKDNDLPW